MIRGKPAVLDGWRHDLERHQRQDRHALGRAQHAYERAMAEPVTVHKEDRDAISQELARQGLQPGADAERALASIARGDLQRQMGITPERTHGRDYDRTDDFWPSL